MFADFFRDAPKNFLRLFERRYLPWHALALALTAVLVLSGFDWQYFLLTRPIPLPLVLPAAIVGFFLPILLPVVLYLWGEWKERPSLTRAGALVAQAELLGYLISIFYKVFTGRTQPEFYTFTSTADIGRDFHFGILQHGVFWGWPSSHAAVALAGMTALFLLSRGNRFVRVAAVLYALYITFGVSVSIHWLSDALAGAIFGVLTAVVVVRAALRT
jgi:membrane-associated phospholipid phosphatase